MNVQPQNFVLCKRKFLGRGSHSSTLIPSHLPFMKENIDSRKDVLSNASQLLPLPNPV